MRVRQGACRRPPALLAGAMLSLLALFLAAGCGDRGGYSQATPDDVLVTARLMVERGQAERLTDLVYAESDQMRDLYRRVGTLLGSLQELGSSIQDAFPEEVAEIKRQAEEAAKKGQASSFISQIMGGGGGGRGGRRRNRDPGADGRAAFNNFAKAFMADPYGWLSRAGKEGRQRLTTVGIADDTAALLWDGQPVFPPIGMAMKLEGEKWCVVLPTHLPGVSGFMPRTQDEYAIWGSLIVTFDQVLRELAADVKSGRAGSLKQVAELAGEKAFIPAAMVFFAYSQALEARQKQAPRADQKAGG